MNEQVDLRYFTQLRRVGLVSSTSQGALLSVDDACFRIDILREDIVRFKIARSGEFDERPTFAVSDAWQPAANIAFEVVEKAEQVRVATAKMVVIINRFPFCIDAYRTDGSVIFRSATEKGSPGAYASLNDEFAVARQSETEDLILGLGQKTGGMNRNGRSFTLWNTDVLNPNAAGEFTAGRENIDLRSDPTSTEFDPYYISIPFFQHVSAQTGQAAGFFMDNGYRGHCEFQHDSHYRLHFAGGQYTEYVFAGPSLAEILEGYTWLTGRMEPPPLWALGYHHCRWHAYTQQSVVGIAGTYRAKAIPCDTLWLDIDYMDGYRVFTWNTDAYPKVAQMLDILNGQGLRVVTIVDPGVKYEVGYPIFDEGAARDIFCKTLGGAVYVGQVWPGKTAFPDFVKPEARAWWGERNAEHIRSGIAGIWNDMNEPATGDIPAQAMRFDGGKAPHEQYHNQYAMLMAMGTVEGLRKAAPDKRTFILSRAGSPGIQRYAANWMGDNMARWDHLWLSMPMAMGLGLSGQPFVGADIGGFAENTTAELLARWMQYGTLTPFCRNHNAIGCIDQYPWSFGTEAEAICRAAIELRYRLMPALYTAFRESSETGLPIQRPLVIDFQNDRRACVTDDQYLLGRSLLVAPVYTPGATSRPVYLPLETWHQWFTGETFAGGSEIMANAPADHIPIFARGGAVVPLWPEAPQSTMGYTPREIELRAFVPQEDGEFHSALYEDDGVTFAYRGGAEYRTRFTMRRVGDRLTITSKVAGQGYPEFAREWYTLRLYGAAVRSITLNGTPAAVEGGVLRFPNSGQDFVSEIVLADIPSG